MCFRSRMFVCYYIFCFPIYFKCCRSLFTESRFGSRLLVAKKPKKFNSWKKSKFPKNSSYLNYFFLKGDFCCCFFDTLFNTASSATVSEDAGIEPRTVATTTLAVGRSNHSDLRPPWNTFKRQEEIQQSKTWNSSLFLYCRGPEVFEQLWLIINYRIWEKSELFTCGAMEPSTWPLPSKAFLTDLGRENSSFLKTKK